LSVPPKQRLSPTVDLGLPNWKEYGNLDKGLTISTAVGVVVAGGTLDYVVLTQRPGKPSRSSTSSALEATRAAAPPSSTSLGPGPSSSAL
jgi:hypothetical protein